MSSKIDAIDKELKKLIDKQAVINSKLGYSSKNNRCNIFYYIDSARLQHRPTETSDTLYASWKTSKTYQRREDVYNALRKNLIKLNSKIAYLKKKKVELRNKMIDRGGLQKGSLMTVAGGTVPSGIYGTLTMDTSPSFLIHDGPAVTLQEEPDYDEPPDYGDEPEEEEEGHYE